ncbi:hypothetical protein ACFODZ_04370 [Marinicella sediminis]|uniref:Sel1 repeat family protein n=1 Tax=Marinicella sediminis TaxID=1792834 RepID=A0ABV7J8Q4_9GAMM|nr:hypothetical protein [Marinicella sediminis]
MKKPQLFILLLLILASAVRAEYGLHFDDNGQIIRPDEYYFAQGVEDREDGFAEAAHSQFLKSAAYGNQLAMSMVGFYHLNNKDLVKAVAWFQLVNPGQVDNSQQITDLIDNISAVLTAEELAMAKKLRAQLAETYGPLPTLVKRESWKKSLKFTGTSLKGYIPPFLRIELNSGISVTGSNLRNQIDGFIYEYEFGVPEGKVTLDDIEIPEQQKETDSKQ